MSWQQELASWTFPPSLRMSSLPKLGSSAPSSEQLRLPCDDSKPAVVTFLRHCGCPFAEKMFVQMRDAASKNVDKHFIAISHSSSSSTEKWVASVGGAGQINVIVDYERALYSKWGLGASSFWHLLNPWSMWDVYMLGKTEGIWNRPTESGSRWQQAGTWSVDGQGIVRWGGPSKQASDCPNFEEAVAGLSWRIY